MFILGDYLFILELKSLVHLKKLAQWNFSGSWVDGKPRFRYQTPAKLMQDSEQLCLPYPILQLISFQQLAVLIANLRKSPQRQTVLGILIPNLSWILEALNSKPIREKSQEIWFQKFSFRLKRNWNFCLSLWYEECLGTDSWFWGMVHLAFWQDTKQQDPGIFN